jgi:hypothetical protein
MREYDLLKQLVADAEQDVIRCEAGNKSAGTRVRKQMQAIKKAAQDLRQRVMDLREPQAPGQAQQPGPQA